MDQNLNYATETSVCYDQQQFNCDEYGRLYAVVHLNTNDKSYCKLDYDILDTICPMGWRVPKLSEWFEMVDLMDGYDNFLNSLCMDNSIKTGYAFAEHGWTGDVSGYLFRHIDEKTIWITQSATEGGTMKSFEPTAAGGTDERTNGFFSLRCVKLNDFGI